MFLALWRAVSVDAFGSYVRGGIWRYVARVFVQTGNGSVTTVLRRCQSYKYAGIGRVSGARVTGPVIGAF